ncbi:integral membrane protein GPR155 isoform X1 [Salmo salar]|uniref:Integral membrane protein GPR155 isoform X1 n=2 Tax=Salmo salar TaxID=8030 RepID=A0ABM3D9I6_SALSA|nr:integral membrane protein GPR155 isoform X1 [Salmo salar]XP_045555476.1 integral membrane protein GPR155 isoform X1 [Salmo salar]
MDTYVAIHGKNISHNPLSSSQAMSIDKLFPALLECFGIILCGYIAGRTDIITSCQAKGLGNFVSKFALPALLFKNMVVLDFNNVIWSFLWSILIAKVSVFVLVCVLTLAVASPESRYSKAGLYSIFATQSNDFALGYPIVDALYRNTHPEYLQYIYLVAPVSLMLLNPIGFAFCEVQKWKDHPERQQGKLQIIRVVLLQVLKNPIVFMVVVGIVSHFVLGQRIPAVMEEFVDGLANSFGGAALFYLGLSMVGQVGKLTRSTGVALILLITAKLLVMPLICKDMVDLLDSTGYNSSSLNHSSLSNYAFLYGVFPTAPSVAIYASQYNMELEVVTSGMVISTFLSAPIMYVSAWLLTIPLMDPKPLVTELQNVSFNISIVSLVVLVWTVAVILLSKKFKRLPHMFSMNLFLAQFLVCFSMILWNFVVKQEDILGQVLTFTLLYGSLYSTYVWTGLIPLCLVLTKKDNLLRIPPGVFVVFGWGIPFLILGGLLLAGERMPDTIDSAFFYGRAQIISTAVVVSCSILVGGFSLMGLSQGTKENQNYQALERASNTGTIEDLRPPGHQEDQTPPLEPSAPETSNNSDCCSCTQPMSDMINGATRNDTPSSLTGQCGALCETQQQQCSPPVQDDRQLVRHVLLCLLLIVSLLANLSSCLWWLFNQDPGRLYLELQFFCAVANYGQGFISFGIFGLDRHLIILPFKKRLVSLWQGRESEEEPPSVVPEEIRLTCTQFVRYHKDQCVQDIVPIRRCDGERVQERERSRERPGQGTYPPSQAQTQATFLGSDLVDWLVRVGLARDRGEAQLYGAQLQQGGVLQHLTHQFGFRDDTLLHYCFTERSWMPPMERNSSMPPVAM